MTMLVSTVSKIMGTLAVAGSLSACASGPAVKSLDAMSPNARNLTENHRIAGYYALPRAFFPITLKRTGATETVEIGDAEYRPDASQYYLIDYATDHFSNDEIVVETDGLGLLKQVAPKSTDATADILKKTIQLGGSIAKLAAAAGFRESPNAKCGPVDRTVLIDPATWRQSDADKLANETCFTISAGEAAFPEGFGSAALPEARKCSRGICYRPALPFQISVKGKSSQRDFLVMAPTPKVTLAATLDRRAITGLDTTLTFSNGMLTKFESTDPNQASALLQIPIDVIATILHGKE